jgi:leucyl-tRNA synthetase
MKQYDHTKIEKKWQKQWAKKKLYKTVEPKGAETAENKKCYILDMFPYPSGEGLHVGHPKGYIATDVYSRFKRMQGFNVLHPMGFDAFGLPAENYAIKNKIHPSVAVQKNIKRYKEQLEIIGFDYDWSREVDTTDPEYYRWTQWIFLQLFKKGLAYESNEPINWCPSCKTGLANEDLEDGKCERCSSIVEKKPIRQWVLRITDYADRLLKDIDGLNWPESIKESQRNWIGRSGGVNFKCKIKDLGTYVEMYNSVPQTYCAETFTVIAPDHTLLKELVKGTTREREVLDFADKINLKKAKEGFNVKDDAEGIFTGRYIENFADTGRDLPIWVASYVLSDYGTGIVNASAHDERDFAFAKKYNIPLRVVMLPEDKEIAERVSRLEEVYVRDPQGIIQEPAQFNGRRWSEVRPDIIEHVVKGGFGTRKTNYRIRDWVFSRQRYWGEPIPLVHCEKCGVVAVPEKDLPVKLPDVKSYEPTGTGESPLAVISKWVNIKCPQCKGKAKRETNTMPQWAGSSWYYLRYMDPKNKKALVDPKKEKQWAPVDLYVGGTEHATRHLIYARFWHKFLYDIGVVSTTEPFTQLKNQGLIMGEDGRKMSKRFGNVVNPDDVIATYGADTFRVYEMFMGPFEQSIAWSTQNMIGSRRFIERVWKLVARQIDIRQETLDGKAGGNTIEILLNKTIKKVGEDIQVFGFNTAISSLMILLNAMEKALVSKEQVGILLQLLAPFAPHMTEELWSVLGNKKSIHIAPWPKFDETKLVDENITIIVQINGKVRGQVVVAKDVTEDVVKKEAQENPEVAKWLQGQQIKKIVYVPGRVVNIVV